MIQDAEKIPDSGAILNLDVKLKNKFNEKFIISNRYNRQLVSFQANKKRPIYRWYKFKEAFSAKLVEKLFLTYKIDGKVLDPFAGIGTTLFAARDMGIDADGIELLPIAQEVILSRLCMEKFEETDFAILDKWRKDHPWETYNDTLPLHELNITRGAYPSYNVELIERYLGLSSKEPKRIKQILRFALLSVLESISYTRQDGQYLRWDYRSSRQRGKIPFNKGDILHFTSAISDKLSEIIIDSKSINLVNNLHKKGNIKLFKNSCLEMLPKLDEEYTAIMTSPPYCNRYDYTRTYALELAMLGITENELKYLRQNMISCTVENREKDLLQINSEWEYPIKITDNQKLLQSILIYLEKLKKSKKLNNQGIPRMIRGYFYEMACIIFECSRILKSNALFFMVNDNVRYAGISISVDMILSDIAKKMGFKIDNILLLPRGKGNSSQQMGKHGRTELRKCIYVWRKI